jgi:hypothetical protein
MVGERERKRAECRAAEAANPRMRKKVSFRRGWERVINYFLGS